VEPVSPDTLLVIAISFPFLTPNEPVEKPASSQQILDSAISGQASSLFDID
jgi:hypothetical protein